MKIKLLKTISESQLVSLNRPMNFLAQDECCFPHWGEYKTNDINIFLINNANVTGEGIVFDKFNCWDFALFSPGFKSIFGSRYILKCYLTYRKIRIDKNSTYIQAFDHCSSNNYYHWIIDTLPRLFVISKELTDCNLLLPKGSNYMKESVSLFKYREILEIDKREYIRPRRLIFPGYIAEPGRHNSNILLEMKQFFLKNLPLEGLLKSQGNKIYVSRGRQKYRKIENEEEVIQFMIEMGFAVVYFEDMSFWEQVNIMKTCRYFISSHGANMTNIFFMQEGGKVLEINQRENPNLCYWSLAHSVNLLYFYQLCEVVPRYPTGLKYYYLDNLIVDIEQLKANIKVMLEY